MPETKRAAEKKTNIGKAEAVQILQSALAYCQQAGITVQAGNANGGLTIILPGVTINQTSLTASE